MFCARLVTGLKGLCQLESMRPGVMQIPSNCQNSIVFLKRVSFSMLSVTSKHRQPKVCGSSLDFAVRSAVKVGV